MKLDIHTHILPNELPDLDAKYGYPGSLFFIFRFFFYLLILSWFILRMD